MKKTLKNKGETLKLTTLGFTLIELLAVIVILAIIALIATPLVMNVVDQSKRGAAESSAHSYIDAVEIENLKNLLKGEERLEAGSYDVLGIEADYKGTGPTKGTITVGKEKIESAALCIDNFYVSYDGTKMRTEKDKSCDDIVVGDPLPDNYLEYTFDTNTNTLQKYNGTEKNVVIPDKIIRNGRQYKVEILRSSSFKNKDLNYVKIGRYVKSMGTKLPTTPDLEKNIASIPSCSDAPSTGGYALTTTPFSSGNPNITFEVDQNNVVYTSIDGSIYTKDKKWLIAGKGSTEKVTIPEGTIGIDYQAYAFRNVKEIVLPASLKYISFAAFHSLNSSVTSISIPDGVEQIDTAAFDSSSFTKLTLGTGIRFLDQGIFPENSTVLIYAQKKDIAYYQCGAFKTFGYVTVTFVNG